MYSSPVPVLVACARPQTAPLCRAPGHGLLTPCRFNRRRPAARRFSWRASSSSRPPWRRRGYGPHPLPSDPGPHCRVGGHCRVAPIVECRVGGLSGWSSRPRSRRIPVLTRLARSTRARGGSPRLPDRPAPPPRGGGPARRRTNLDRP